MKKNNTKKGEIVIYKSPSGSEIQVKLQKKYCTGKLVKKSTYSILE